jgi:hypothetical protein
MLEHKKNRYFSRFWIKESGLSSMLLLLFIMQFIVIPLFGNRPFFMVLLTFFWTLLLTAGIFALAKNKKQAILMSVIPFLFVICNWVTIHSTNIVLEIIDLFLTIITVLMLIIMVLIKVFEPGPINAYRILGSIVVYMLLAHLWCIIYLFIFNQIEGSFQLTVSAFKINSDLANFMYFSYITLTSTGFGEIVPLHPIARSVVQLEAVIGILYPVILIGRLVSEANFSQNKSH